MISKMTLPGKPLSTNQIYKIACSGSFPRYYMSSLGKGKKEGYQWQIKAQWTQAMLTDEVELEVHLYFDDMPEVKAEEIKVEDVPFE